MEMLEAQWAKGHFVCVGLDSEYDLLPGAVRRGNTPEDAVLNFNRGLIQGLSDVVAAFKPNAAFYNRKGSNLRQALVDTFAFSVTMAPGVVRILDGKRGDIGNSNRGYVEEADMVDADAETINPFMGADPYSDPAKSDGLEPFLRTPRGAFILCRTSNKCAARMQDCLVLVTNVEMSEFFPEGCDPDLPKFCGWVRLDTRGVLMPYYQKIALEVSRRWNTNDNCGLVVGATVPNQLRIVRRLVGDDMVLLLPGAGKQAADLVAALEAGLTAKGDGILVNASRSVIFAANDHTYATAARAEVVRMNAVINEVRLRRM